MDLVQLFLPNMRVNLINTASLPVLFIASLTILQLLALAQAAKIKRQWAVHLRHPYRWWLDGLMRRQPLPITSENIAMNIAKRAQMTYLNQLKIGNIDGIYLFEEEVDEEESALKRKRSEIDGESEDESAEKWADFDEVAWAEVQVPRKRAKRELPAFDDPLLEDEWFLSDGTPGPNGLTYDFDINRLWSKGYTGKGVTVGVIDDGLDFSHPEFSHSYRSDVSWDFNRKSALAPPSSMEDHHGTRCAGQIASKADNGVCGVGVAYSANLAGLRLISEDPTDIDEASAMTHAYQDIQIYSSSWGPNDDGMTIQGPGYYGSMALKEGVMNGRGGRGSIYVFAGGNGGNRDDICTYDGYSNSIYTITIGAVTPMGQWPYYSEFCASQLVSAYSGDGYTNIPTTDIQLMCASPPCCTNKHFGTSAATPFVSALIALMLEMRPDLNWRDVQNVLIRSTVKNDPDDTEWVKNGAGYWVSHRFGYGVLHSQKLFEAASSWELIPSASHVFKSSPSGFQGASLPVGQVFQIQIPITESDLTSQSSIAGYSNILSIEHVELYVDIRHPARGSLRIELVSPSNTTSLLARPRNKDLSTEGIRKWTFMTARHWGERPQGNWILRIHDSRPLMDNQPLGVLTAYKLTVHGLSCQRDEWVSLDGRNACPWEVVKRSTSAREEIIYVSIIVISLLVVVTIGGIYGRRWYKRFMKYPKYGTLSAKPSLTSLNIETARSNGLSEIVLQTPTDTPRTPITNQIIELRPMTPYSARTPAPSTPGTMSPRTPVTEIPPTTLERSSSASSLLESETGQRANMRRQLAESFGSAISPNASTFDAGQLPSPNPLSPIFPSATSPYNFPPRPASASLTLGIPPSRANRNTPRMPRSSSLLSVSTSRVDEDGRGLIREELASPKSPASKARVQAMRGAGGSSSMGKKSSSLGRLFNFNTEKP